MALIPLTRTAMACSDIVGDTSYKYLSKLIRYANSGVKDLYENVVPLVSELNVTSQILPIGNNWMVELPQDFIYETKIGLCVNGRIVLLGVNEDLCGTDTSMQNCPCSAEATQEITNLCCGTISGDYSYTWYNSWRSGQQLGELYGMSGGKNYLGYYKIDKLNNRMILSSELPGQEIIIEYKADYTFNGVATIPTEIELAVKMFVLWMYNVQNKPSLGQMYRLEYEIEYEKLKKQYSTIGIEEWRNVFLKSTTSSIKR